MDPAKRAAVVGGPALLSSLPAVTGVFADPTPAMAAGVGGVDPPVFGEVRYVGWQTSNAGSQITPGSNTDEVDSLASRFRSPVAMPAVYAGEEDLYDPSNPVLICVDPGRRVYAVSGLAWARVRMWTGRHRFARFPYRQSSWQTEPGWAESSYWGPLRILGFVATDSSGQPRLSDGYAPEGSYPQSPSWQLALVRF
ncbi:MAG: hypothetical protein EBR86_16560 [Planctomycetia bacterium]|nr:hypothetical protein [Planctomycetia bacterium]